MACLNPAYGGGGTSRNERRIHIRRSTSTSTHFENIKPPSGTFAKHITTIEIGGWLQSTGISGLGVVQQVKEYLSPYYCKSLRIPP